ncbi:MAG TPA: amylo-alpha-1,6-glucosidase [Stellaceae bacterium]|nr:amylo-alpha-1,6-glucosidase [Stellaceae bacterium]
MPKRRVDLVPLRLGRDICGDLAAAERREWWLANGRGGYAAGTVALSLTRRYHGLLIAPVDPPLGRTLVLAKGDATATIDGVAYPLFTNRWRSGAVAPEGYRAIDEFTLDGTVPVWRSRCGGRVIEHRIWLEPGADTVYIAWRLDEGAAAALSVAFLANGRDHHGDTWPDGFQPEIAADGARLTVTIPGRFALSIAASDGSIAARRDWYWDFDLPVERERGLGDRDAHLHVGDATLTLEPGRWVGVAAGLGPDVTPDIDAALARRRAWDRAVIDRAVAADPVFAAAPDWVRRLVLAADAFRIARPLPDLPEGRSVIAGYPWFGDWGRDTMIALPGLCLATGRAAEARTILDTFARFVDGGMLPNVFPDSAGARPEYNTADASLWYIEAWRAYVAATGDEAALRAVFPVLAGIIAAHQAGTRYGIGVDPADGLLRAGVPGVQLTWMDAKVGDWVVTPRIGKPVEINALWHNALVAMTEMAGRVGQDAGRYHTAAGRAKAGFARFVRPDGQGLYDVLDGPDGDDASLRPNQVFAVSLPASPLDAAAQRAVLDACAPLVTPVGLRSLAPNAPGYRAQITGGVVERDGAYHQGTVWAWLLGAWALAQYRVFGDAAAAQECLAGIAAHLGDAGLGQVSEIFDGDQPHTPRGCPAQAWSVACVLEAWWRLEHARLGK